MYRPYCKKADSKELLIAKLISKRCGTQTNPVSVVGGNPKEWHVKYIKCKKVECPSSLAGEDVRQRSVITPKLVEVIYLNEELCKRSSVWEREICHR